MSRPLASALTLSLPDRPSPLLFHPTLGPQSRGSVTSEWRVTERPVGLMGTGSAATQDDRGWGAFVEERASEEEKLFMRGADVWIAFGKRERSGLCSVLLLRLIDRLNASILVRKVFGGGGTAAL